MYDPSKIRHEIFSWLGDLPEIQKFTFRQILEERDVQQAVKHASEVFYRRDSNELKDAEIGETSNQSPDYQLSELRPTDKTHIRVQSVKAVTNVNALADGEQIEMADGVTIIYGRNGAGKSGYFRILASESNSRTGYKILPNVTSSRTENPTGEIAYKIDDELNTFGVPNKETSSALQQFLVFDTKAANIHITENNEVEYTPPELAVFDDFLECLDLLERKREEIKKGLQLTNTYSGHF